MGKGFFIFLYVIILPITGIFLVTWIVTYRRWKKHTAAIVLLVIWGLFILLTGLLLFLEPYLKPMVLTQKDIVGTYVIDKSKFPGKQADWQYDNFRIEITENDELIFESRTFGNNWKADTISISYSSGYYDIDKNEYCNRKLRILSDTTSHHIIRDNPTLFRQSFNNFYYVFESKKFGNVFFKKGQWK